MNTRYAIRVDGHLDDHWSGWLGGLTITRNSDGTSTLTGPVADQAQLHGALAGLRDIGATLLDLHATDPTGVGAWPAESGAWLAEGVARLVEGGARLVEAVPSALDRTLRTERLTLRPAGAADAIPAWKAEHRTDPTRHATTVVIELGHDPAAPVIGDLHLHREDAQAAISWRLDPSHRGHGLEAVRELLRYCFEDLGLRRITAGCPFDDDTTWQLMEHVGMRRETHAVQAYPHPSGRWLDFVAYALLAEEWKGNDVRAAVEAEVQTAAEVGGEQMLPPRTP